MFTFNEIYRNPSYIYTEGVRAFKQYLLDQLNTERGSRPYYPDYGNLIEKYKHSLLTLQLAQRIHSDVYFVLTSMENVSVTSTNYHMKQREKRIELYYDIVLGQEPIGLHLTYSEGVFK